MGTNYYAEYNKCHCCNRKDSVHIGKSFRTLRVYPDSDLNINCWNDWLEFFGRPDVSIVDEYGEEVDLFKFITSWKPLPDAVERVAEANSSWAKMFGTPFGEFVDDRGFICTSREFS